MKSNHCRLDEDLRRAATSSSNGAWLCRGESWFVKIGAVAVFDLLIVACSSTRAGDSDDLPSCGLPNQLVVDGPDVEVIYEDGEAVREYLFSASEEGFYIFSGESTGYLCNGPRISILDGYCEGETIASEEGNYTSSVDLEDGTRQTRTPVYLESGQMVTVVVANTDPYEMSGFLVNAYYQECPTCEVYVGESSSDCTTGSEVIESSCDNDAPRYMRQTIYSFKAPYSGDFVFSKRGFGYLAFIMESSCTGEVDRCVESVETPEEEYDRCFTTEEVVELEEGETILVVSGFYSLSTDAETPYQCTSNLLIESRN